jgi:hypothetical protein
MQIKKLLKAAGKYISDSGYRFLIHEWIGCYDHLSDESYLKRKYRAFFRKELNLENPQTFNEKIQWLKLYDRKPEYTVMVDKYRVREYIAQKIGEEYLIPLLGVWEDPEDIDFDALPDQFVLKCNHNSGIGMWICKDKEQLDEELVRKELKIGLQENYYFRGREWSYKDIPRRILAEAFLSVKEGDLADYKIHVFNGEPRFVLVCADRFAESGLTEDFYTPQWEHLDLRRPGIPNAKVPQEKPQLLEQMLLCAKKLSEDFPFVRADFYECNGKIYFGEMTFYPACGMGAFDPPEWDETFGSWLKLPNEGE